jgi:Kef-type K+ transport system membrane component KefB
VAPRDPDLPEQSRVIDPGLLLSVPTGGAAEVTRVFLMLVALVTAARIGGTLATRIGQPAVLGELVAGILIGPSLLGFVDPNDPFIHVLAEFGVVILLFQIGLHTDLGALIKVGPAAAAVGVVGVVLPFGTGFLTARVLGVPLMPSIVCGAAMTATSIGISARILGDLGSLDTREGKVVLGAAVLDDVAGLIILAVVATMARGGDVTVLSVTRTVGLAVGFLVVAVAVGGMIAPRLFAVIDKIPVSGTTGALALAFALLLAALADLGGSALIIGAFAAGLVLHWTPQRETIEDSTSALGHFFVPVFFASVGAAVDIRAMAHVQSLQLGGMLLVIGILGKFIAGYAPFWVPMRHALVGAAMVPRGEVGLIFARMGLATAALTPELFGALMIMVIGTTFVTPPWLAWLARRGLQQAARGAARGEQDRIDELMRAAAGRTDDIGTVDDLVSGERREDDDVPGER